ncbi:lipase [Providencia rettgeri]|uniref:Lipase n=1 Tax=Providencia rettgeri TaxID=587 RepID=A0AAP2NXT8_PRORE|nr:MULTISPECIES: SGNH/GDSL hydrolase family protein [Providencia]EJD6368030.1 lipase [Providencia rettgeri]EJD6372087.1 lipase [Providencia rettgeri]EJD6508842.1 lipase [Providencia rettgeri]EJD6509995.1 lipase [Providencia rettgeri]EJD6581136.1 lipase [Providencia rettgeri]
MPIETIRTFPRHTDQVNNCRPENTSSSFTRKIKMLFNSRFQLGGVPIFNVSNPSTNSINTDETDSSQSKELFSLAVSMYSQPKDKINNFERVIVVGDSLSDSEGRMLKKTLGLLPSAPQYYKGRFTNGFTWVDFLTSPTVMSYKDKNSNNTYRPVEVINKAEGGAVCATYNQKNPKFRFISNIKRQIQGIKFNKSDLAIISIGSNDYMTFNKTNTYKVISSQLKAINKMIKHGAQNILIMGIPDPSKTPFKNEKPMEYENKMKMLTLMHNQALENSIKKLNALHSTNIVFFDIDKTMTEIYQQAKTLNYETNLPFANGYIGGKEQLDTAPPYLFNDNVHPTQEVHAIVALKLNEFIAKNFKSPVDPTTTD